MTQYTSILPLRTKPVKQDDFLAVPHFALNKVPAGDSVTKEALKNWNKNIPLTPADASKILRLEFPQEISLDFEVLSDAVGITMQSVGSRKFGASVAIDTADKSFFDSAIMVQKNPQGGGYGKAWLRSMIEFTVALAFPGFRFSAGDVNGGYVWARAGAYLDFAASEQRALSHTSRQMIGRIDALKEVLPSHDYERARALSRLVAKEDFANIARLETPVPMQDAASLQKSLRKFYEINGALDGPEATSRAETSSMMTTFGRAAEMGQDATLAQLVLGNVRWKAVIDYSDMDQMRHVGEYVGGWKTIAAGRAQKLEAAMR